MLGSAVRRSERSTHDWALKLFGAAGLGAEAQPTASNAAALSKSDERRDDTDSLD